MGWTTLPKVPQNASGAPDSGPRDNRVFPALGEVDHASKIGDSLSNMSMGETKGKVSAPKVSAWGAKSSVQAERKPQGTSNEAAKALESEANANSSLAREAQPINQPPTASTGDTGNGVAASSRKHVSEENYAPVEDHRDDTVVDASESMLIIQAKEWDEESIRYGCQLMDEGTSLKLAAREAGCMIKDLKIYFDETWCEESDDSY